MNKVRPEVDGLTERVFTIRQQYLVPWIPGPYQLSINFQVSAFPLPHPIIQMKPGEKHPVCALHHSRIVGGNSGFTHSQW